MVNGSWFMINALLSPIGCYYDSEQN